MCYTDYMSSPLEAFFTAIAERAKTQNETTKRKTVHNFDSMVRGALIELDGIDPELGDWLVGSYRGVLDKIAQERALGKEGVTA